ARAMMLEPKIILLDEPTEGLMPRMVSQIHEIIDVLHRDGVAILLVEQNVPLTLEASDRVYIMEKGVVRHHAPAADLRANHAVIGALLQVTTLRPLLGSGSRTPQEVALTTILATFGISLVLQKYALWQWGPSARKLQEPITGQFTLFYLQYPWYRIATALLS